MILLTSSIQVGFELITLILIFIIILLLAFYTSKWIGNSGLNLQKTRNTKIMDVTRIAPNKFIYIVKTGDKCFAVGVTKDHMEYLTEVNEDSLILQEEKPVHPDFYQILKKVSTKEKRKE